LVVYAALVPVQAARKHGALHQEVRVEQDVRGALRAAPLPKMRLGMGEHDFSLALVLGAFLLASWVDAKVGDSRPESPIRRIGHVFVGVLVLQATVGALYLVKGVGAGEAGVMAAILGIFLPALVYTLLGGLWVLRSLVEITGVARR
jgi:hypothetical protein